MALPYKKIVVKFGTSTITGKTNSVDYPGLIDLSGRSARSVTGAYRSRLSPPGRSRWDGML